MCPFCCAEKADEAAQKLAARNAELRRLAAPLPGAAPYAIRRPLKIPPACDGLALDEALARIFPDASRAEWARLCESGCFFHELGWAVGAGEIVRAGARYVRAILAAAEPPVNGGIRILHEDGAVIVVLKPAPLPMHPAGPFQRHTLRWFLHTLYAPESPRPLHELAAETGGVVVFARTRKWAGQLAPQFARGAAEVSAERVSFTHPLTRERLTFCADTEVPIARES